MIKELYQKPLGKDESFRMERPEALSAIREGDLVQSRYMKVVAVDEEKREQLLKGLDRESVIAKRDLELMHVGVSLDETGIQTLQERYGPFFRAERQKYRVMYIHAYSGSASVWVGPPELTVEDAAQFGELMRSGEPRGPKFGDCRPVDIAEVKRMLDS